MTLRLFEHRRADRIALMVAGLAALAFVVLMLVVLSRPGMLQHLDTAVNGRAHRFGLQHPLWLSTMSAITRTGSTTYLAPAASVACLALLRWREWRQAAFVAVAALVTVGLRLLIVVNVARPRPAGWLTSASGWSFPSGHSTAAAAAAAIAVIVGWPLLRRRRDRLVLAGVTGAWAIAVGVSRVALGVHWPSDVLGAWLLVAAVVPPIAVGVGAFPARRDGKR
ncbi:phosphatase PAP2 family protein [Actinoplanes sp. NPDC048791]|uniref:phosphatase PAP2 family protein n=1 Tax=Actinoplanes sp. NPDC048791 TaxID=3154623 RepID=UPI0033E42FD8